MLDVSGKESADHITIELADVANNVLYGGQSISGIVHLTLGKELEMTSEYKKEN